MSMKTLNLNSIVRVRIKPFGINRLREIHEEFQRDFPFAVGEFCPPPADEDGFSEMQLWVVMHIFGNSLYNGAGATNLPIDMNIQIKEEDLL